MFPQAGVPGRENLLVFGGCGPTESGPSDAPEIITVDVKGAVKQPGVYELRSNSRVHDAIYKAGGMTADANSQSVNLAQKSPMKQ